MFKYLLFIGLCISPLALNSAENTVQVTDTSNHAPLSESIELIIQDLNKAIALIDNPKREIVLDNLERINTVAGTLLMKLVVISRMDKQNGTHNLDAIGITHEQVANLARAYYQFYRKLKAAQNSAVSTAETDIIG